MMRCFRRRVVVLPVEQRRPTSTGEIAEEETDVGTDADAKVGTEAGGGGEKASE